MKLELEKLSRLLGSSKLLLFVLVQRKSQIEKEGRNLDKINLNIEKLTAVTGEAEAKIDTLNRRIDTLDDVEKKLSKLSILAEDVDVKIRNLKKEESVVQKAGDYVSEAKVPYW